MPHVLQPLPSPSLYRSKPPARSLIIKRLSPTELNERRDKELCFNCDEKFGLGHRCKHLFYLEGVSEEEEVEEPTVDEEEEINSPLEVSLHAVSGMGAECTM